MSKALAFAAVLLAGCSTSGLPPGDQPGQPGIPRPFTMTPDWVTLWDEWQEICIELGLVNLDDCPEPPDPASWPPGGPLPEFPYSQVLEGEFGPLEDPNVPEGATQEPEAQDPNALQREPDSGSLDYYGCTDDNFLTRCAATETP